MSNIYLNDLGIINALGHNRTIIWNTLQSISGNYMDKQPGISSVPWADSPVFSVDLPLPDVSEALYNSRVNQFLVAAADQIDLSINAAVEKWGRGRIGIILGSTDNGSEIAYASIRTLNETGEFPDSFNLDYQNANNPAAFLKRHLNLNGPEMSVSTACSSSAIAMIQARELIENNICDAVICGGADIVSQAVYMGFRSLEAMAAGLCNPFSSNRSGITLGEGAALFLMSHEKLNNNNVCFLGGGESSDAHHMTAPHPDGLGAEAAMKAALGDAGLAPEDIDYLNLHGTGTELNDSMESKAVFRVFGSRIPCSSTKSLTGHTLGASGATEAGIAWIVLMQSGSSSHYPIHRWDGEPDKLLPELNLITSNRPGKKIQKVMSNSFAFGGNNASLILGVGQ